MGAVEMVRKYDLSVYGAIEQNVAGVCYNASRLSLYWQTPQFLLVGVAESFTLVAGVNNLPKYCTGRVCLSGCLCVCVCLCVCLSVCLSVHYNASRLSLYWQTPQFLLMGVAESFTLVAGVNNLPKYCNERVCLSVYYIASRLSLYWQTPQFTLVTGITRAVLTRCSTDHVMIFDLDLQS